MTGAKTGPAGTAGTGVRKVRRKTPERTVHFEDPGLVRDICGENDRFLALVEQKLGVTLFPRGNEIDISGSADAAIVAEAILRRLYEKAEGGAHVELGDVDGAIRMLLGQAHAKAGAARKADGAKAPGRADLGPIIRTQKRNIEPRTPMQAEYLRALQSHELVFGLGPAGTGKTYLAVAFGVALMLTREVDRLILSRPAVEAGERLGFLPGDMREKIDPYLRPLYDALNDTMIGDQVQRRLDAGEIEVAPLAFMRGRTLSNAYVILDEAQNTTSMQMKMFLTRLGENSRMVVTGDPSQTDLPPGEVSGLREAEQVLKGVEGVGFVRFTAADVVRHALVGRIIRAYDKAKPNKGTAR